MYEFAPKGYAYHYHCEKCGTDRGFFDYDSYATRCPRCQESYTTTLVKLEDLDAVRK